MSKDLTVLLQGWDYNSNEVTVRRILGVDGREKIQMRLDLGVLQMEVSGRPDGKRPYGHESLLEFHLERREEAQIEADDSGRWLEWSLDSEACGDLKQEAMQFYYRYLSMFHLGDYDCVVRDTERNIRAFDLIRDHAEDEGDRLSLEQFRPYVLMMRARALACIALESKEYSRAMDLIDVGVEQIKDFFFEIGREDLLGECRELQFLEEWAQRIETNKPLTPRRQTAPRAVRCRRAGRLRARRPTARQAAQRQHGMKIKIEKAPVAIAAGVFYRFWSCPLLGDPQLISLGGTCV